jgi:hypothetical protein
LTRFAVVCALLPCPRFADACGPDAHDRVVVRSGAMSHEWTGNDQWPPGQLQASGWAGFEYRRIAGLIDVPQMV